MRLLVRFLPGSLLLCAAAIALVLLWDSGDAHADPQRSGSANQGGNVELAQGDFPPVIGAQLAELGVPAPDAAPALLFAAAPPTTPSFAAPAPIITSTPPPSAEGATATPVRSAPSTWSSDEAITGAHGLVTPALSALPNVDPVAVTTELLAPAEVPSSAALGSVLPAPPAPPPDIPPTVSLVAAPAAVPDALAFAASPDLAISSAAPDRAGHSSGVANDAGGAVASFASRDAPARGPPAQLPVPPCPDGSAPHAGGTDFAGVVPVCADDATRRALLLAGAHSYSSTSLFDPLLRPD